ncbi:Hypothetical protein DEACI_2961 [Acididesulfobacillus acetoxydans]|uniref:Uncharacterized protein n=1 Tax=Acididesulfobacillus acetoxydans TaxID=1561005 RepID=A0A8S0XYT8_9FIRM|nr:hypothetical protein [Acididesulfobacillus acetoxydans]CAA7602287.1 Hypothetical protein DEACI_2961 [Acididesulfobacillus acetoxydans]CEJ07495.1 Hypothetical protein DEACI_1961 [Acididesulfobacillus acetoxydans]
MASKWIAILLAGFLWGVGADIDFTLAFGLGGTAVFLLTALVTVSLFWYKAFRKKLSSLQLWIGILHGLMAEALLFVMAGLIFGLTSPELPGPGLGFPHLLVYLGSAIVAAFFLLAFFLIVRFLKARVAKRQGRPLSQRSRKDRKK